MLSSPASSFRIDPRRAVAHIETFLSGCHEKAEEIADSSGSFGQFAADLICAWIEARQDAGADAVETAERLLQWMDNDPYGFCYEIEHDVANVFNKPGMTAFAERIRSRFDAANAANIECGTTNRDRAEYNRKHWGDILRTLYRERSDLTAAWRVSVENWLRRNGVITVTSGRRVLPDFSEIRSQS